jgi:hypothetical protein
MKEQLSQDLIMRPLLVQVAGVSTRQPAVKLCPGSTSFSSTKSQVAHARREIPPVSQGTEDQDTPSKCLSMGSWL